MKGFFKKILKNLFFSGEVRCFILDDLGEAAALRRPLRVTHGQAWLKPPVQRARKKDSAGWIGVENQTNSRKYMN